MADPVVTVSEDQTKVTMKLSNGNTVILECITSDCFRVICSPFAIISPVNSRQINIRCSWPGT